MTTSGHDVEAEVDEIKLKDVHGEEAGRSNPFSRVFKRQKSIISRTPSKTSVKDKKEATIRGVRLPYSF